MVNGLVSPAVQKQQVNQLFAHCACFLPNILNSMKMLGLCAGDQFFSTESSPVSVDSFENIIDDFMTS
jgi:hypothetical protein